jgi:hypothetical protein
LFGVSEFGGKERKGACQVFWSFLGFFGRDLNMACFSNGNLDVFWSLVCESVEESVGYNLVYKLKECAF